MTISSTTRKAGPFVGNDVTTAFPFTFKVFDETDVLAVVSDDATGVETTLELTTDFSVALNADQDDDPGGDVILNEPLAEGTSLVITSQLPLEQPVEVTNQGGFYPAVFNNALDRLTIFAQQLQLQADRAMKATLSSGVTDLNLIPLADGVLRWSADGSALETVEWAEFVSLLSIAVNDDTFDEAVAEAVAAANTYTDTQAAARLAKSANLSDLTDAAAARGNLGLGSAATRTAGTGAGEVLLLSVAGTLPALSGANLTGLPSFSLRAQVQNTSATLGGANFGFMLYVTGANAPTFTLDEAADAGQGCIRIANNGTGNVTVQRSGADLIDGLTSYIMYPGEARDFFSDGTSAWVSVVLRGFAAQFTASGTFVEPPGYRTYLLDGVGGGGAGGGSNASRNGTGGGGGQRQQLRVGALPGTNTTVTVGAGGVGVAAAHGTAGGDTTFGTRATFKGGSGGLFRSTGDGGGTGGSGGGVTTRIRGYVVADEINAADAVGSAGAISYYSSSSVARAGNAEWGGGAGGPFSTTRVRVDGGSSLFGAGGGAGAHEIASGLSGQTAGVGGKHGAYTNGGGGAAGVAGNPPTPGGAGTDGNLLEGRCGDGGGSGGRRTTGTAGAGGLGGAGGACGGGGGGSGMGLTSGDAPGGNGGRGELVIYGVL